MAYTYWLPDENGQKQEYGTASNAVIIIGANGSGKSKLGAWIEQQDFERVHRIGAQRNLNFGENIPLKSFSEAEDLVLYGNYGTNTGAFRDEKAARWGWRDHAKYTTTLLNDFENVLAALLALNNNERYKYFELCREAEFHNQVKPNIPITIVDKLYTIWDEILPQRKLILDDSKFFASFDQGNSPKKYSANQMSDGERAVLYLVAQVLCVPENKMLIIDEPEIHLHRSIMNRLWITLERYRPDCLFIYITHDTQFAAMHPHADKVWIKEFDGANWVFEEIESDDLPEELLFDILGSRKNVLFVEGEKNSFDTQLYSAIYSNYHVIPCGSCTQVIARTKAFRSSPSLHDCHVYGIVDRDYRSDYEIEAYKVDNIYTLDVAEVENLFIVEELIRLLANHMGKDSDEIFASVKNYVIGTRFANQINGQICQSVVAQIKYKLACAEISKKNEADAKASLNTALTDLDYDKIKECEESRFKTALDSGNYADVIKAFNEKGIAKSIGHFFGIQDKEYCSTIIALLHGEKSNDIINALLPYLPAEIPR